MKQTVEWLSYKEQVKLLSDRLVEAQRPIRIREGVKWDESIEADVIASKFRRLPAVDEAYYREKRPLPYDPETKLAEFEDLKRDVLLRLRSDDCISRILLRNCNEYQDVVRLLMARGTPQFYELSKQLYGSPKERFAGDIITVRELGMLLYEILSGIPEDGLGAVYPRTLPGEDVVERLNGRFLKFFSDDQSVHAKLDDGILSDAAAGADYVKIRRGVMFSERDLDLLEVHEGWVHIGTSLNGARQRVATWLSKGPPCTAAIQEGLAVIVEMITFNTTPSRAKKLNNRILACDKAEDGADFLDVCEFYRTEGYSERECFQHSERVFRGGVVSGGSPFTKDISYCKGFIMIYNFLRTAIRFGRPDLIPFLFAGKLTLDDVPLLYRKFKEGVVDPPHYMPPQFADLNGLAMWMAYSNFFNRVNLSSIQDYYRRALEG